MRVNLTSCLVALCVAFIRVTSHVTAYATDMGFMIGQYSAKIDAMTSRLDGIDRLLAAQNQQALYWMRKLVRKAAFWTSWPNKFDS